jgi:hypothetical protein
MAKGVKQGCPLSSILAALVLHEVLAPIDAKLKIHAANRLRLQNTGDDETGGETRHATIPNEDVEFFFDKFTKLGPRFLGCHLNTVKTRIQMVPPPFPSSNVNTARSLLIAFDRRAIVKYSVSEVPLSRAQAQLPSIESHLNSSQCHPSAKLSFQPTPLLGSPPELPTDTSPTRPQLNERQHPNGNCDRHLSSRSTTWVPILRQVLL